MSWLFDQLSDLACADAVSVVIAADTGSCSRTTGSIDVAELLVRASEVPNFGIELLPARLTGPTLAPEQRVEIDLGSMPTSTRVSAVRKLLQSHRSHCGAVLRLQGSKVLLEPYGTLPDRKVVEQSAEKSMCWMLASELGECAVGDDDSTQIGLRVSIGGMSPGASVNVEDVTGFISLLDALVSLREVSLETSNSV